MWEVVRAGGDNLSGRMTVATPVSARVLWPLSSFHHEPGDIHSVSLGLAIWVITFAMWRLGRVI